MPRYARLPIILLSLALLIFAGPFAGAENGSEAPLKNATEAGSQAPAPNATAAADDTDSARDATIAARIEARARQELGLDLNETLGRWKRDFARIEQRLVEEKPTSSDLTTFRTQLEALRDSARQLVATLEPHLTEINAQAEKLGGPLPEGQTETEEAAITRAEVTGLQRTYASAKSVAEQMELRANQLISRIQDIRRNRFTTSLFERAPGVAALGTWTRLPERFGEMMSKSGTIIQDWWRQLGTQGGRNAQAEALQIIGLALGLMAALFLLMRKGTARLRHWPNDDPPFWKRASSAAGVMALRVLPVTVPALFFYHGLRGSELLTEQTDWLFYSLSRSLIIIGAVNALIQTVVAPNQPGWRLTPLSDSAAARVRWLVVGLATIYALHLFTNTLARLTNAPVALAVALSFIASLAISGLLIAVLRTRRNGVIIEGAPELNWLRRLHFPLFLLALAILLCAVTGFVALARFIATQVIVTGTILAAVYLLMVWVDALAQSMSDDEARTGQWLQATFGFDARRRGQLALPISLLLKFFIVLVSVPLIMLQWGFNWGDVQDWSRQLFFGFQIGNTEISIAAILAAMIVFLVGFLAAKLLQSWLDRQVLKPAGLSGSVRDSIRTAIGYLGVVVAALIAFSYAGLDLSNLAIVAGAFSVGIGFGLQSVVSNFVSGLILLAERPIKVGDWVVVGGEEGFVRKISVRSTEIETFDRANVLVPNSYFITETVKNWTLHNNMGRISIAVGAAYSSDPRQVKEILLKVAREHVNVMNNPEPFVFFKDFGSNALEFVLYAYIYDLSKGIGTRTDLRIAIVEEFRKAGISIPFQQSDVALKDMDWLKDAVIRYLSGPSGGPVQTVGSVSLPPAKTLK